MYTKYISDKCQIYNKCVYIEYQSNVNPILITNGGTYNKQKKISMI